MRFCADSIRSCFFIEKFGSYRLSLLTGKGYDLNLLRLWFFSVLDGNSYHLLQFSESTPTTNARRNCKRSSKVECMRTTNLAQTIVSLPSPLMGFHLQVDFLNKIHLSFFAHMPFLLQLYASVSVALE